MNGRFAFVGGLQRSGTTLLGQLLAQHTQMTGMTGTPTTEDEGQFVQDLYLTDHELGRQMHREMFTHAGRIVRWAYHPRAHLTEQDALQFPDARERLGTSWSKWWAEPEAAVLIEKSPSNLMRTRFLQEIFPDARFLVITRHPIAQALAVRKWAMHRTRLGIGMPALIDHWLTAMECYADDRPSLEYSFTIRYEDLVADPIATLDACQRFLGVPVECLSATGITDQNARYAAYWSAFTGRRWPLPDLGDAPLMPAVSRRVEAMVSRAIGAKVARDIFTRYGQRIARFGYDVANPYAT